MDELLHPTLQPHTPVQVRCRYDGSWVDGFEIASASPGNRAYQLRRVSDGAELPTGFNEDEIRPV